MYGNLKVQYLLVGEKAFEKLVLSIEGNLSFEIQLRVSRILKKLITSDRGSMKRSMVRKKTEKNSYHTRSNTILLSIT